jgi:hypothetical protein
MVDIESDADGTCGIWVHRFTALRTLHTIGANFGFGSQLFLRKVSVTPGAAQTVLIKTH